MNDSKVKNMKTLLFILLLCVFIFVFTLLITKTFAGYVTDSKIKVEATTAVYIFEEGMLDFNIDLGKIVPNDEPYIYSFTISNFNSDKSSDVDISYTISLLSTTNLPLEFALYKNIDVIDSNSINLIDSNELVTDEDGSWYRLMNINQEFNLYRTNNSLDTYYLVVDFPKVYSVDESYSGLIDDVELKINSKQMVE